MTEFSKKTQGGNFSALTPCPLSHAVGEGAGGEGREVSLRSVVEPSCCTLIREPRTVRFPSRSGGNLQEGGKKTYKGDDLTFEELKTREGGLFEWLGANSLPV